MEKFILQTQQLLKCTNSSTALLDCVQVQHHNKNSIYCLDGNTKPQWNYILEGMSGAYDYSEHHTPYMHWLALPGQSFTGTKHEYSDSSPQLEIRFLKDSRVASIKLKQLRKLMQDYPPIERLINILRQRRATITDLKLHVMAHHAINRYHEALHEIPTILATLNNNQIAQYLNIDPKTLYKSRKKEIGK